MRRIFIPIVLAVVASGAGCASPEPQPAADAPPAPAASPPPGPLQAVPPFHAVPELGKPFPRTLSPEIFKDYPQVAEAYRVAGRIPEVLAQQPCYCWCDSQGHGSLLDCYATDHGAG